MEFSSRDHGAEGGRSLCSETRVLTLWERACAPESHTDEPCACKPKFRVNSMPGVPGLGTRIYRAGHMCTQFSGHVVFPHVAHTCVGRTGPG